MADSIPSLRRKLAEAHSRIQELEARKPEVVERVVEVKGPVVRVEVPGPTRFVNVEVPGPERVVEVERLFPYPVETIIYYDNPDHVETIRKLQEQLWQFTSALDLSLNQGQGEPSSQSADLQAQE